MEIDISLWAAVGFLFAAYAVVGNDALQTLGTFINANRQLPWQALFIFAGSILVVIFYWGYFQNAGDPSFGRLSNTSKYPIFEPEWYHALPPLALLVLTRFGIPVSTTFMVLSIFATFGGMQSMLEKSLIGYALAFVTGGLVYAVLAPTIERWFLKTKDQQGNFVWIFLQWISTGYLWSVWLMQDFANIFIFLPRGDLPSGEPALNLAEATIAISAVLLLLCYTFWNRGGPVQRIIQSKTGTDDIRSAAVINFIYGTLLFYFKELNNIPMSTTWVFLGLIAGREFAIATIDKIRPTEATARIVFMDAGKAFLGLVVSVALAVSLPPLAAAIGNWTAG